MVFEDHPHFQDDLQSGATHEELVADALEMVEWAATDMNDGLCREEAQWLLGRIEDRSPEDFTEDEEALLLTLGCVYRLIQDELQSSAENYNTLLREDTEYVIEQLKS